MPAVTALPYDVATAKVFGQIRAKLEETGTILPDADIQIAATAIYNDLELVSGNLRNLSRIAELKLNCDAILTRDRGIYKKYFPELKNYVKRQS